MRSPEFMRNGEGTMSPNPRNRGFPTNFQSTVSVQKLRRFNSLILIFRLVTFCFSLASTVFMAMNSHIPNGDAAGEWVSWTNYDAFRYVVAGNAIICLYSLVQMGATIWEILKGTTILPETIQVWFDFSHDQAFAYLLFCANSAGTVMAQALRSGSAWVGQEHSCNEVNAFCIQSAVSISLGFGGAVFLAASTLLSGFKVACWIINGSRFHL
ncbi:hypothetical protein AMTRI_Chr08g204360 [Amborella trichopoda]|uniref:CASP-like protein n=1 Tax=Amborella trichopoda TaxID=13333 RepID=W1PJH7_AMBTC|nr:CASP-like protein 4C1 [Amborella trichopoda]ERN07811.1 hypothetical protein AMTR_s00012p00163580 [Amborella trichopoda]|eukprot:XP_006846136.1 CASP-like protein 4C1 [Amborella trichopoda]